MESPTIPLEVSYLPTYLPRYTSMVTIQKSRNRCQEIKIRDVIYLEEDLLKLCCPNIIAEAPSEDVNQRRRDGKPPYAIAESRLG